MLRSLVSGQSTAQWIGWNCTSLESFIIHCFDVCILFLLWPLCCELCTQNLLLWNHNSNLDPAWFNPWHVIWITPVSHPTVLSFSEFFPILPHFQVDLRSFYVNKKWQGFFPLLLVHYKCRILFHRSVLKGFHDLDFQIFCLFHRADSLSISYGLLGETGKADDQLIHLRWNKIQLRTSLIFGKIAPKKFQGRAAPTWFIHLLNNVKDMYTIHLHPEPFSAHWFCSEGHQMASTTLERIVRRKNFQQGKRDHFFLLSLITSWASFPTGVPRRLSLACLWPEVYHIHPFPNHSQGKKNEIPGGWDIWPCLRADDPNKSRVLLESIGQVSGHAYVCCSLGESSWSPCFH